MLIHELQDYAFKNGHTLDEIKKPVTGKAARLRDSTIVYCRKVCGMRVPEIAAFWNVDKEYVEGLL